MRELSSKDLIIAILSREWPLSTKELHHKMLKETKNNVTYQAVHKLVTLLESEKVVVKNGKTYQLGIEWLRQRKYYYETIYNKYTQNSLGYDDVPKNFNEFTLVFNDISKFCVETARVIAEKKFVGNGPNIGVGVLTHVWWPLEFNFPDFRIFMRMTKNVDATYALVRNDAPLDRWLEGQWYKGGFGHVKLRVNVDGIKEDIIVHGDTVWQVNYSEETKQLLDRIYTRARDLTGLFREYFFSPEKETQQYIEVKLTRNPMFAELMRKKILEYFNGEKILASLKTSLLKNK